MAKRKKQTKKKSRTSRKKKTTAKKSPAKAKEPVQAPEVSSEEAKASDDAETADAPKLDASELDKLMKKSTKKTTTKKAAKPKRKSTKSSQNTKDANKEEQSSQEQSNQDQEAEEALEARSEESTASKASKPNQKTTKGKAKDEEIQESEEIKDSEEEPKDEVHAKAKETQTVEEEAENQDKVAAKADAEEETTSEPEVEEKSEPAEEAEAAEAQPAKDEETEPKAAEKSKEDSEVEEQSLQDEETESAPTASKDAKASDEEAEEEPPKADSKEPEEDVQETLNTRDNPSETLSSQASEDSKAAENDSADEVEATQTAAQEDTTQEEAASVSEEPPETLSSQAPEIDKSASDIEPATEEEAKVESPSESTIEAKGTDSNVEGSDSETSQEKHASSEETKTSEPAQDTQDDEVAEVQEEEAQVESEAENKTDKSEEKTESTEATEEKAEATEEKVEQPKAEETKESVEEAEAKEEQPSQEDEALDKASEKKAEDKETQPEDKEPQPKAEEAKAEESKEEESKEEEEPKEVAEVESDKAETKEAVEKAEETKANDKDVATTESAQNDDESQKEPFEAPPVNGISKGRRPQEYPALSEPIDVVEEAAAEGKDESQEKAEPTPEEELREALLECKYLTPELLLSVFQSAEQGVFLFHRRARRRLFLDKVGLNHKHPLPESPVHHMASKEFMDVLKLEDPDLFKELEEANLPEHITLLDQLSARRLRKTPVERIIWRYWSWLTSSQLMLRWDALDVPVHEIKALLGHTTFEEVRSYFVRERYVFFPEDEQEVVRNLVGYWGMMSYFAPQYRNDLFPSILPHVFDTWLAQKGLDIDAIAERVRPDVPFEVPRHLPAPRTKPWIKWGLADDKTQVYASSDDNEAPDLTSFQEVELDESPSQEIPVAGSNKGTPPPPSITSGGGGSGTPPLRSKDMQEHLHQPSLGAMFLLAFLIGGGGVLLYFLQRLALFHIRDIFGAIGQFGGPHHQAAPSIDPYGLMFLVWGGLVVFAIAHVLDLHFQWRMFLRWRREHFWATLLHPDDQEQGRRLCQQHANTAWTEAPQPTPESPQVVLWEFTKAFLQSISDSLYIRVWGSILEAIPDQSMPLPVLDRWVAHRKLAFHVYTFRYYMTRGQKARRRGNDVAALQAFSEALTFYKPFADGEDKLWRRLTRERTKLQRRISTLFGEDIPHMSSPSGRALNTAFLFILLCAMFLNTSGLIWSVFWGFALYVVASQLMDVQVANRGLLHFWRDPVWKHYLSETTLEEGQRTCNSKTKVLLDPSHKPKTEDSEQPLYMTILKAATSNALWWLKVRLWGRVLTSLLFHWGRHPILLRFTAREIMRKQVFEYIHHLEWAMHEKHRGNDVEAAIQLTDALAYYRPLTQVDDPLLHQLYEEREALLKTITNQWLETHRMGEEHRASFRTMLEELLDVPLSTRLGQQCAALLKTLQRSYLDKDRTFFTTQPFRYLMSLRRQPLERSLENYGLVRSMHYLQTSLKKLSFLPLSQKKRQKWAVPLQQAQQTLEAAIREQFRPLMLEAMEEAGLKTTNHREEIAQNKICEELLDCIIRNGRFSFSDVRDVISRNDLRLKDPGFRELLSNDVLLRMDKQFEERFHEIYRESEIYLRMLQRVSNVSFGTGLGRFAVKYLLIPFGGSAFILVFMASMIEAFYKFAFKQTNYHSPLKDTSSIVLLGFVIGLIVHTETGRDIFKRVLAAIGDAFRYVFVDAPRWVLEREAIQNLIRHPNAFVWYRFVLIPLLVGTLFFGMFYSIIRAFGLPMTLGETLVLLGMSTAISYLLFLTSMGRAFWDQLAYRSIALWQQIKDRWVIGLFHWIIDTFRMLLHALDYVIYRGDDLLRFHPGEGRPVILFKAIGQGIWSSVAYLTRMIANLFVEPQVNPIKHFPVVTVSHKMISAATAGLIPWMIAQGYSGLMTSVVTVIFQLALPGLCGFLVWEFKENWKLFQANYTTTKPALVGSHGETMDGMLRRGFHSGTLPKIYEKLNKFAENEYHAPDRMPRRRQREQLHHVVESLETFVERELLAALRKRQGLLEKYPVIRQEHPLLSPNHIDMFLVLETEQDDQFYRWRLRIELEGGVLVGSIKELDTPLHRRLRLLGAEQSLIDEDLENFLKKCGIRLLRGKLENWLRFYLRGFEVGVPGSVQDSAKAEYFISKEEVRVKKSVDHTPTNDVVYRLDEKGRLYEPAPVVTLSSGDELLPRPNEQLQLSGQYRVADILSYTPQPPTSSAPSSEQNPNPQS
ncbi:MAG: hypothetical protein EP343_06895 [Deltaproteobacteria bacterium]|nr:MAG: hypothetical protein EP343_06895 [Deltaproteobacteria bacterium]